MIKQFLFALTFLPLFLSSCASSKKQLATLKVQYSDLETARNKATADLDNCNKASADLQSSLNRKDTDLDAQKKQVADLQAQVDFLKKTNTSVLDRMADLSIVTKAGAESIQRSLETLNAQSRAITNLNSAVQRKDSVNLALVMNLKRSLADINDQDVQVEVKKGVVYVSISDKMLFELGKYKVTDQAETVLGKVARVLNDHKELDILVEGHTDAIPYENGLLRDNWDLSVLRATAVTRLLQEKFGVSPDRMTAGGRSEFAPKQDNATADGRRMNRRTEIIVTPKLDQFFNLLNNGK